MLIGFLWNTTNFFIKKQNKTFLRASGIYTLFLVCQKVPEHKKGITTALKQEGTGFLKLRQEGSCCNLPPLPLEAKSAAHRKPCVQDEEGQSKNWEEGKEKSVKGQSFTCYWFWLKSQNKWREYNIFQDRQQLRTSLSLGFQLFSPQSFLTSYSHALQSSL